MSAHMTGLTAAGRSEIATNTPPSVSPARSAPRDKRIEIQITVRNELDQLQMSVAAGEIEQYTPSQRTRIDPPRRSLFALTKS